MMNTQHHKFQLITPLTATGLMISGNSIQFALAAEYRAITDWSTVCRGVCVIIF